MRQVATSVLRRCMHALPMLRDTLISSLATFIMRLPEDYPGVHGQRVMCSTSIAPPDFSLSVALSYGRSEGLLQKLIVAIAQLLVQRLSKTAWASCWG